MWILTEEYNEYDQYGEYFLYAWLSKPSREELAKRVQTYNEQDLDHVYNGGGRRQGIENHWYIFRKFTPYN